MRKKKMKLGRYEINFKQNEYDDGLEEVLEDVYTGLAMVGVVSYSLDKKLMNDRRI
jgi:hypothetical protein